MQQLLYFRDDKHNKSNIKPSEVVMHAVQAHVFTKYSHLTIFPDSWLGKVAWGDKECRAPLLWREMANREPECSSDRHS